MRDRTTLLQILATVFVLSVWLAMVYVIIHFAIKFW